MTVYRSDLFTIFLKDLMDCWQQLLSCGVRWSITNSVADSQQSQEGVLGLRSQQKDYRTTGCRPKQVCAPQQSRVPCCEITKLRCQKRWFNQNLLCILRRKKHWVSTEILQGTGCRQKQGCAAQRMRNGLFQSRAPGCEITKLRCQRRWFNQNVLRILRRKKQSVWKL